MIFYCFTHAERAARRAEIVAYARSGERTLADIAEKFKITYGYARILCKRAKITLKRKKRYDIYDWSKAPWGKPNAEIAAAVGCSHQAVAQKRTRLKIPQVKAERRKRPEMILELLKAGYTIRDVCLKVGVGRETVKDRAKEAGIVPAKTPPPNLLKVDWSLVNWQQSDIAIAKQLNCHPLTITRYRKRLGIPGRKRINGKWPVSPILDQSASPTLEASPAPSGSPSP